jgi:plasmid stabilization system protein ParE
MLGFYGFNYGYNDSDEIIDFITEDNPVAAIEQGDEIESQVAGLLENSHHGRPGLAGAGDSPHPRYADYRIKKRVHPKLQLYHMTSSAYFFTNSYVRFFIPRFHGPTTTRRRLAGANSILAVS